MKKAPILLIGAAMVALVVAVALRTVVWPIDDDDEAADALSGRVLDEALPRPDFTLTTTEGQPFDFTAETAGRLTLLFFGYTSCPDVCPIHLATLAGALEQSGMPRPVVVFVGVDPARDTPEAVREFLDRFDPEFIGLVGTEEEIAAAHDAAGVSPSVIEPVGDDGQYQVGHPAQILAYTSDDLAHVVYPFGVRQQEWANDLPRLESIDWSDAD